METVKTRKVGNSISVTIPRELNISVGKEYCVYKGIDDIIVLAPKVKNPLFYSNRIQMSDEFKETRILNTEIE